MRTALCSHTTIAAHVRIHAVAVPGAAALAVRPNPINGQAQALVVCHLGICPLQLNDSNDYVRLEGPLILRNQHASKFNIQSVHDAIYDTHSGQVLFANGTGIYGMDATNRVAQLSGDIDGGLIFDGPASEARFVGAQRLATDGQGVTYIRDRDAGSRNGFCLRALHEATPAPPHQSKSVIVSGSSSSSSARAVVTVDIGSDTGPHAMTYDTSRCSLLFATRGRALYQLLPFGITRELLGTDEPIAPHGISATAAAASAAASASETSDDDDANNRNIMPGLAAASLPRIRSLPFVNVQALAADAASGNVYILDGTTGSKTMLRVLRPDGSLDTIEEQLRIGPTGNSRWPRLAVLPYGHLAVYGASVHEIMLLKLGE
ncbi:hypothetical protein VaNZ11_005368 [Volvox africanus]|uniref:Uncharacterized protein n=1 Tax=Volvox africanus TaxID=51714 RepID=A0ABQ5S068_9CHLO|nr:hypothetical protein VaNZ11_005368 [Volvox africanus]